MTFHIKRRGERSSSSRLFRALMASADGRIVSPHAVARARFHRDANHRRVFTKARHPRMHGSPPGSGAAPCSAGNPRSPSHFMETRRGRISRRPSGEGGDSYRVRSNESAFSKASFVRASRRSRKPRKSRESWRRESRIENLDSRLAIREIKRFVRRLFRERRDMDGEPAGMVR